MKKIYKIFLVDDHRLFREGLTFVISQMDGFEVVGTASDGDQFLKMIDNLDVDIVLMDIFMPGLDGISATVKVLEKHPGLKIIALTMFSGEEYYNKMVQAGVSGYILKESGKDELATALNTIIRGENYFSEKVLPHNSQKLKNSDLPKRLDNSKEI